ncbi:hypothetical protein ACWEPC_58230, partial [Nonomuraea sp. NPDC004297]
GRFDAATSVRMARSATESVARSKLSLSQISDEEEQLGQAEGHPQDDAGQDAGDMDAGHGREV